jgi:hypothetical protein
VTAVLIAILALLGVICFLLVRVSRWLAELNGLLVDAAELLRFFIYGSNHESD